MLRVLRRVSYWVCIGVMTHLLGVPPPEAKAKVAVKEVEKLDAGRRHVDISYLSIYIYIHTHNMCFVIFVYIYIYTYVEVVDMGVSLCRPLCGGFEWEPILAHFFGGGSES